MTQTPPFQGQPEAGDAGPTTGTGSALARPGPSRRSGSRWIRAGLVGVLLVVGGVIFWKAAIAPNLFPRNFGVVEEGRVYRSGRLTAAALERLHHKRHIKTIVDFGGYDPGSERDRREQRTAEALGIKRYVLRLEGDGTGNPNNYVQALRLMSDPDNWPVLVHCSAGAQRTGCAVVLYRHIVQDVAVREAFVESQRYDHEWEDNPWMMVMIAEHGDEIARAFREGGWITGHEAAKVTPEASGVTGQTGQAGPAAPATPGKPEGAARGAEPSSTKVGSAAAPR